MKMNSPIFYLQIIDEYGPKSQFENECMDSVRLQIRNCDTYKCITIPYSENKVDMVNASDMIRLSYSAVYPNLCYVDTDCKISIPLHKLSIWPNRPYFCRFTAVKTEEEYPDYYYYYVNGRTDYFRKYLNPGTVEFGYHGIDFEILRSLKDFNFIQDGSYSHGYTTAHESLKKGLIKNVMPTNRKE